MKKRVTSILLAMVLTVSAAPVFTTTECQAKSKKVYYVVDGEKYHSTKNCRTLSRSKNIKKTTLKKAKKSGLEACKVCH